MYYEIPKKQAEELKHEKGENIGKGMRRKLKGKGEVISDKFIEMGKKGGKVSKDNMLFMENSMHTGMSMPTKQEFLKGGKMKSKEHQVDIPEAIKNLALLAEKFGLRLMK